MHQLRITLNGLDVHGSPFQFSVQSSKEDVDPLMVNFHPKDLSDHPEPDFGINPTFEKMYPGYMLDNRLILRHRDWTPPSAPSTETWTPKGSLRSKQTSIHRCLSAKLFLVYVYFLGT